MERGRAYHRQFGPWSSRAEMIDLTQFEHQADATLGQDNPVTATLYTVLGTTKNVRIISIMSRITWATTQPTPLEIIVTIDGNTLTFPQANPVSTQEYIAFISPITASTGQGMYAATAGITDHPTTFLLEGRSVKVEARITWATTQPTPLACRVKWARRT